MSKMNNNEFDGARRHLANSIYKTIQPQVLQVATELMSYYNDDDEFDVDELREGTIKVQITGNVFTEIEKKVKRKIILPRG